MPPRDRTRGFTLLELLVAVAVFAVVAALATGGLRTVLDAEARTAERAEQVRSISMMFSLLERDLRHAVEVRTRDVRGERRPIMEVRSTDEGMEAYWVRMSGAGGRALQGVIWRFSEEEGVERITWAPVDADRKAGGDRRRFVDALEPPEDDARWIQAHRRPADVGGDRENGGEGSLNRLPALVELNLTLEPVGSVGRMMVVGGSQ
ncbi:prepilin-type N-terminal cleavage/methylation domain-containing protein [Thioalkalivibrio sp. ALE19]|uniref:prepilin-type N-terminal cleavage/methylation domain-containing protein n=1 Tax=Thioalkalivibrio sp. ALE19 TaxID=1266909 RepID=UPI000423E18E|nr:prepilin-type N-terminal cleavage/methylation domain-containing protein [Thioalkalivibrio sp. ALE19]